MASQTANGHYWLGSKEMAAFPFNMEIDLNICASVGIHGCLVHWTWGIRRTQKKGICWSWYPLFNLRNSKWRLSYIVKKCWLKSQSEYVFRVVLSFNRFQWKDLFYFKLNLERNSKIKFRKRLQDFPLSALGSLVVRLTQGILSTKCFIRVVQRGSQSGVKILVCVL